MARDVVEHNRNCAINPWPKLALRVTLIRMDFTNSQRVFARAKQLMPGGVNSPARAFGGVGGEPVVMARGEGAYLWDVDGNRYIDYVLAWGPMILGHAQADVSAHIHAAVDRGTSFGAPTEAENRLCELIAEAMPSIEMLRLVSSGTEATMSAIRLARGFTGRDVIIKFAGNYHGHVDSLLVAAGSSAATLGVPNSPGIPVGATQNTLVLPYNGVGELQAAFAKHGPAIAGVIFEPVVGNMGLVLPSGEFVTELRRLTQVHGALLIADEVMTGFRVAHGGAQSLLGFTPDLTTLGKIVGGGLPIGAYGGRAEIMRHVLPVGKVFQAGTNSGNPIATAAGIATLEKLRDPLVYQHLDQLGAQLAAGLRSAATLAGIPHTLARVGSMLTLFFGGEPVHNWDTASRCNTKLYARFFWEMLRRGVYLPCSQYEALFLSAAHTRADVEATVAAAQLALAACRE